ncbi:MAG: hypothetical protein D6730_15935 [Bacteroidetes bacterium]|nr:MAG: hypothetical protein D6730_15935 [Bacteroidota bacterium]
MKGEQAQYTTPCWQYQKKEQIETTYVSASNINKRFSQNPGLKPQNKFGLFDSCLGDVSNHKIGVKKQATFQKECRSGKKK